MRGFTLLEILAVVALMASLLVFVLPQLTQFNKIQGLQQGASQLQSDLREVQNNAISGVLCPDSTKASDWYLEFKNNNYYYLKPTCSPLVTTPQIGFPANVTIGTIYIDSCPVSPVNNLQIHFSNISGMVNFGNIGSCIVSPNSIMTITLKITGISNTIKLIVEKGGAIYVSSS
ncbi:MAG: prepilin-type N-terminal cleavage/methylation domain-containing protein [Patescibacteria group bacterium]|nr:prepilin-type N-terminal cleavage/methylation domain-containing protein [Patescibacteria group bacterium]